MEDIEGNVECVSVDRSELMLIRLDLGRGRGALRGKQERGGVWGMHGEDDADEENVGDRGVLGGEEDGE